MKRFHRIQLPFIVGLLLGALQRCPASEWLKVPSESLAPGATARFKRIPVPVSAKARPSGTREALVVYSSDSGIIWAGTPNNRVLVETNRIVGLKTLMGSSGGSLILKVSASKLELPTATGDGQLDQAVAAYLSASVLCQLSWAETDLRIPLADYVGHAALLDLNRSDAPPSPTIIGVGHVSSNAVVTLKTAAGKTLKVTLSGEMAVVRAEVDGRVTFDDQGRRPPTLQEELRALNRKSR